VLKVPHDQNQPLLKWSFLCLQGRQKDATVGQQRLGHNLMQNLRERIDPFFLRRTKQDVGLMDDSSGKEESSAAAGGAKYAVRA